MTSPPRDLLAIFPTQTELAAVVLFALMVDAHQTGNDMIRRAAGYRLRRLGWRVEPVQRSEGGAER